MLIKPDVLFKYGLLRKILFTEGVQATKVLLSKKINTLFQDIFAGGLVHKGYICLEINDQPPGFSSHHPCFAKQEVKFRVVHYQGPRLDVFTSETFHLYVILGEIRRKLRMWRSYALSTKVTENVYLLNEDCNTKIYDEFELKKLKIDMQPEITHHLKEIKAQWIAAEVGDKKAISQVDNLQWRGPMMNLL